MRELCGKIQKQFRENNNPPLAAKKMNERCTRCEVPSIFPCPARKPHCYECRALCNTCDPKWKKQRKNVNIARKLEIAIRNYDTRAISSALDKGADAGTRGKEYAHPTLLHIAAKQNDAVLTKRLVNLKLMVSAEDDCGITPLWHAACHGHNGIVQILVENGADANDINLALQVACNFGNMETAKLLIQKGADVKYCHLSDHDTTRRAYWSVSLVLVCDYSNREKDIYDVVEMIIDRGADVNTYVSHTRRSLLAQVLWIGQYEVARLLLSRGANVSTVNDLDSLELKMLIQTLLGWKYHVMIMLFDYGLIIDKQIEIKCPDYTKLRCAYDARKQICQLCLLRDAGAPLLDSDFLPRDMFNLICQGRLDLKEE